MGEEGAPEIQSDSQRVRQIERNRETKLDSKKEETVAEAPAGSLHLSVPRYAK